jgi:hypothetical protein
MGAPEGLIGTVTFIGPCPQLEDGPGRVVLTTVNHLNNFVFDLTLTANGAIDTLGVTGTHRIYTEDRGWIAASELTQGEVVRTANGDAVVSSLVQQPGTFTVYNMTVEADHVYYVGEPSALVHNTCPIPGLRDAFSNIDVGMSAHQNFESALTALTKTRSTDWRMRTSVGQVGVDATYIGPRHRRPGFWHAELKPNTYSGYSTFLNQLGRWNIRGETQLFFYNEQGIIGSSGYNFK